MSSAMPVPQAVIDDEITIDLYEKAKKVSTYKPIHMEHAPEHTWRETLLSVCCCNCLFGKSFKFDKLQDEDDMIM